MEHHPHPPSRFERPPGHDPLTRRDESLAFAGGPDSWRPPAWFDQVAVVLVQPTDPVNIGGVVRAMANCGFRRLRLVDPAPFDPWDVIGVAHYTQHIVEAAGRHAALAEAVADATLTIGLTGKHQRAQRNALPFQEALARVAEAAQAGGQVALVLGREDRGLSNADLDWCQAVTTIPTNPAHPSLNLAQATLLTLYALFQRAGGLEQPLRPPRRPAQPASAALLANLFADLERALAAIHFQDEGGRRASAMRSLRAALYRARLDAREAALLRAVFIEVRRYLHRHGLLDDVGPIGVSEP